jgi:2'-5' RNA ligase
LFLGSVDPARVVDLRALVDDVAAASHPYEVQVELGGGRLRRGEGVAWLGLGRGAGSLIETADAVAAGCPADVTDGARPKRTPSAHLTVARRADAALIEALREQAHGPLGDGWTVDRIELLRSHLEPGGARYETLHRSTL